MTAAPTRREQILATAAELFAAKGFHGVSLAELGAACGVSGPAVYRHFASKDAMLAEMLVAISEELLSVGRERAAAAGSADEALSALVAWHVDFALHNQPLIVVQDRDWASLTPEAQARVRTLQREYVELWVSALRQVRPELDDARGHAMVHATFGLLNSTPRSSYLDEGSMSRVLHGMALAAMASGAGAPGAGSG